MEKEKKSYIDRLMDYEADKAILRTQPMSSREYEEAIRKLIKKHKI